jgi:hypothetical protein
MRNVPTETGSKITIFGSAYGPRKIADPAQALSVTLKTSRGSHLGNFWTFDHAEISMMLQINRAGTGSASMTVQ